MQQITDYGLRITNSFKKILPPDDELFFDSLPEFGNWHILVNPKIINPQSAIRNPQSVISIQCKALD